MLVICQSCGHSISDQAFACPKCKAEADVAFGAALPCHECNAPIRPSADLCRSCGAPAAVALGRVRGGAGLAVDTAERQEQKRRAEPTPVPVGSTEPPKSIVNPSQTSNIASPGFSRGGFGKSMAFVLLIIAGFAVLNYFSAWTRSGGSAYTSGYQTGQFLAVAIITVASLRAILKRRSRTIWDWLMGIYLLLACVGFIMAIATAFRAAETMSVVIGPIYLFFVCMGFVACATVAVRLLRKPYLPT